MGERNSSSLKKEETMHPNKTLEKKSSANQTKEKLI